MPNISSAPPSGARHPIFNPERRDPTWGDFSQEEVRLANRNSGTLLETLRHDVTPAGLHYLLIHFDVPYVPVAHDWMLVIGGCVERPLTLTLDELKRHQNRTLRVTMECAGNGRAAMTPRRPTQPWLHEAVGTAEWTGTPLKPLWRARASLPTPTMSSSSGGTVALTAALSTTTVVVYRRSRH